MTNIQLPVFVTDLFFMFGVTDPAQMLIVLLSLVLGVLLVLIILIAFRGRSSSSNLSHEKGEVADSSRAKTPAPGSIIPKSTQPQEGDALAAHSTNIIENSELLSEQVEDFQIFKRPKQKSTPSDQTAPSLDVKDPMSTAEHLRLIEQKMVRVRGLYQDGHITREMYIDETRSLYLQARELTSIS